MAALCHLMKRNTAGVAVVCSLNRPHACREMTQRRSNLRLEPPQRSRTPQTKDPSGVIRGAVVFRDRMKQRGFNFAASTRRRRSYSSSAGAHRHEWLMSAVANAEQWRLLISGSDGRAWWDAADCAEEAEDRAAVRPSHYKNATIDRKVSGNSSFCLPHRFSFPVRLCSNEFLTADKT